MRALIPRAYRSATAAGSCAKVLVGRARRLYDGLGKESRHDDTGWTGEEGTGVLAQCVGDAYTMLDLLPGVDPNGPALVWLADQFVILRRGDCPPAHAMTL